MSQYLKSSLLFLRSFLLVLVALFGVSVLYYWLHYRADLVDRHLLWSDFFKIILSGGFGHAGQVLLCAMVFSLAWLLARNRIKRLTTGLLVFLIVPAGFGFYLVGFLVPENNLYNYSMYYVLLEQNDQAYQPLKVDPELVELFEGSNGCTNYMGLGRVRDTLEAQNDSSWNRHLKLIRDLADPRNIQKLLANPTYGKMFSAEDFEGVTAKYEGFNLENAQKHIETIAQNIRLEKEMREEVIAKNVSTRAAMVFYPLHFLIFCLVAVCAGILLREISLVPLLAVLLLVVTPIPVFAQAVFGESVSSQWIGVLIETLVLLVLFKFSDKRNLETGK